MTLQFPVISRQIKSTADCQVVKIMKYDDFATESQADLNCRPRLFHKIERIFLGRISSLVTFL